MLKECSIIDGKGNHCPGAVTRSVNWNGKMTHLCEGCLKNVLEGAYGKEYEKKNQKREGRRGYCSFSSSRQLL
jgi:hypothetical protein